MTTTLQRDLLNWFIHEKEFLLPYVTANALQVKSAPISTTPTTSP
jgi:hypothetical protein